jgi:ribosomal protein L6P/L9E
MRLKVKKLAFDKRSKPFRWKMWFERDKFSYSVVGPLGVAIDSFSLQGVVFHNNTFFFYNQPFYNSFIARLKNRIDGVCFGFFLDMFYKGLGYKAWVHDHKLYSALGYSHFIEFSLPLGMFVKARKNHLLLFSSDKERLNDTAKNICKFKVPDPYRGKGVRFVDVDFFIKPGKQR